MDKIQFSQLVRCTPTHWRMVLRGERNLSFNKAKLVSQLIVTPIETWINPEKTLDRQAAWEKFSKIDGAKK